MARATKLLLAAAFAASMVAVCVQAEAGMLVYDSNSGEYVCAQAKCAKVNLLNNCGVVPNKGIVATIGKQTTKCLVDNDCIGRDLVLYEMQNPNKNQSASSMINAASLSSCGNSDATSLAFGIISTEASEVQKNGVVGVNLTAKAFLSGQNNISAVLLARNVNALAVSTWLAYWRTPTGQDSSTSLALRTSQAISSMLNSSAGLEGCLASDSTPEHPSYASTGILYSKGDELFAVESISFPVVDVANATIQRVQSCISGSCNQTSNFGDGRKPIDSSAASYNCVGASKVPDNLCFPAGARVRLEDGSTRTMAEVSLGDRLMVGHGQYSDVYTFSHRLYKGRFEFVRITSSSGHSVALSPGHYIYANRRLTEARMVQVDDVIELDDGRSSVVLSVRRTREVGLVNPHTRQGDIVVDGVRCSTFTSAVSPKLAPLLLTPLRLAYDLFAVDTTLAHPSALLASLAVPGRSVY